MQDKVFSENLKWENVVSYPLHVINVVGQEGILSAMLLMTIWTLLLNGPKTGDMVSDTVLNHLKHV